MKTPMQELIEIIEKIDGNTLNKEYLLNTINVFIKKEKYQIINSFNQGFREGETETMVADIKKDVSDYDDAINYYNSTFGDNPEAGI